MELFGIVISVPVALVASTLYSFLLSKFVFNLPVLSGVLRVSSYFVLALLALEIVLLETMGAVKCRGLLGPGFYTTHLILFFLCPPALANLLVLRPKRAVPGSWLLAGALCTILAFCMVLLQYSVSEALYGIDGDNGPYSALSTATKL